MGIGTKYDFTKIDKDYPAPNQYNVNCHTVEYWVNKNPKISFGVAREKCRIMGSVDLNKTKALPGPHSYKIPSAFGKS